MVKGVSSLYDKDGKLSAQWVKSSADAQRQAEMHKATLDAMCEEIVRIPALAAPAAALPHLCNVYTLTDSHVGMLAWRGEGGADWGLKIAERTLVGCFEMMVSSAPPAGTCVVNQLGDFLHSDGLVPVTPTSGHVLDQDGRFAKVVRAAIRILRRVIYFALMRHEKVVVLLAEGDQPGISRHPVRLRKLGYKCLYVHFTPLQ